MDVQATNSNDTDKFNVGHDVSNEMMTIIGYVELARGRILSGGGSILDDLAGIEAAAKRAVSHCRKLMGRLPAHALVAEEVRKKPESGPEGSKTLQKVTMAGGRVLLVDDESSVRAVARQMLDLYDLLRPRSGRNGECKNGRGAGEGARGACDGGGVREEPGRGHG